MPLSHVAPTIRATIASLKAGVEDRIEIFNDEEVNEVELTVPADESYIFGGDDQLESYSFPAIEVYQSQGEIGLADLGRGVYDLHDRLVVTVWCEGVSGEVPEVYEKILGYGRCILEVLLQPDAFGSGVEIANEDSAVQWSYVTIPIDPAEDRSFDKFRTAGVFSFALEDVSASA